MSKSNLQFRILELMKIINIFKYKALNLSANGIISRDELVFEQAFKNKIPILMVLSGGYQEINAPTIADSIENLNAKFNLLKNIEKSNKM